MSERKETIIYQGKEYIIHSDVVDDVTWYLMNKQGYRSGNYPVPAHQYIVLHGPHSVEMVTGIVKTYDGGHTGYDCDCVFWCSNYTDKH